MRQRWGKVGTLLYDCPRFRLRRAPSRFDVPNLNCKAQHDALSKCFLKDNKMQPEIARPCDEGGHGAGAGQSRGT